MARYIDADALIRLIEIDALCCGGNFSKRDVIACVKASPAVDVIPKSEYEALKETLDATIAGQESLQKYLANKKQEVTKEIIEFIDRKSAIIGVSLGVGGRRQGKTVAWAKVVALEELKVELEKKYIGGGC